MGAAAIDMPSAGIQRSTNNMMFSLYLSLVRRCSFIIYASLTAGVYVCFIVSFKRRRWRLREVEEKREIGGGGGGREGGREREREREIDRQTDRDRERQRQRQTTESHVKIIMCSV